LIRTWGDREERQQAGIELVNLAKSDEQFSSIESEAQFAEVCEEA
jgi:hypothetical protein